MTTVGGGCETVCCTENLDLILGLLENMAWTQTQL